MAASRHSRHQSRASPRSWLQASKLRRQAQAGVAATQEAVRGPFTMRVLMPRRSPRFITESRSALSPRTLRMTSICPSATSQALSPGSPSRKRISPSSTATGSKAFCRAASTSGSTARGPGRSRSRGSRGGQGVLGFPGRKDFHNRASTDGSLRTGTGWCPWVMRPKRSLEAVTRRTMVLSAWSSRAS